MQLLVVDVVRRLRHQPLHSLGVRRGREGSVVFKDLHIDVDRLVVQILDKLIGARFKEIIERNGSFQRDILRRLLGRQLAPELGQKVIVVLQVVLLVIAVSLKLVVRLLIRALLVRVVSPSLLSSFLRHHLQMSSRFAQFQRRLVISLLRREDESQHCNLVLLVGVHQMHLHLVLLRVQRVFTRRMEMELAQSERLSLINQLALVFRSNVHLDRVSVVHNGTVLDLLRIYELQRRVRVLTLSHNPRGSRLGRGADINGRLLLSKRLLSRSTGQRLSRFTR